MKFFTPELYRRFTDRHIKESIKASKLWDVADREYTAHLNSIQDVLTDGARKLSESCFHDRIIDSVSHSSLDLDSRAFRLPDHSISTTTVVLRNLDEPAFADLLMYFGVVQIEEISHGIEYPFHPNANEWRYDELYLQKNGFVQHILLGNGKELVIPFSDVAIYRIRLPNPVEMASVG